MAGAPKLVYGTAIACGSSAALIRGPSGSGKSDLALRCICLAPTALIPVSAVLVSDDQVFACVSESGIELQAPTPILGKIEVRGLGLVEVPYTERANLTLLVDIVAPSEVERLPEDRTETLLGFEIPLITIAPFENSAPLKLLLALSRPSSLLKAPP